jgi:prolyl-tRNA synthetase
LREAVTRALGRCGIPFETVGTAGGCEFFTRCEAGDDVVVASDDGAYVATLAEARTGSRPWTFGGDPAGELEVVPTPGASSVGDVARFLRVRESDVLKTMVFRATPSGEWTGYETPENLTTPLWVVAVVRGDHEVNVGKLAAAVREEFHITSIELATEDDAGEFAFGYVGPDAAIRKVRAALVVDPDAAQDRAWVAGANEPGHHVRNFNWFRECGQPLADPRKVAVADIRNVVDGDPAPGRGAGKLRLVRGITLGRIVPLPPAGNGAIMFQDEAGASRAAFLGACEVNLSRVMAAAVETGHDERGIVWPDGIAPYSVVLTPIQYGGATREAADRIYADLLAAGVDVLLDDRDLRPGTKFADADLIGLPIRINVGERGLQKGVVELKRRTAANAVEVEVGRVVDAVLGR